MIFGEEGARPEGPQGPQGGQQRQSVQFDVSKMESLYANFFALAGSADEITLYFGVNTPLPGSQQPPIKVSHRLLMQPANAKRLMLALQQTIKAHEDRFGPIELPPNQNPRQQ